MTLDDLQQQLAAYDAKLDRSLRLSLTALRDTRMRRAESALRRLAISIGLEVALNCVAMTLLGGYCADHIGEPRFFVPAFVLDLVALALILTGARQLAALASFDRGAPVVALQKRLERLRVERILVTKWVFLLAPVLWTPLLIVALNALGGIDAWVHLGTTYLVLNVIFGVAVMPILLWIARRVTGLVGRSRRLHSLLADVRGDSLARARAFLTEIESLECEPEVQSADRMR